VKKKILRGAMLSPYDPKKLDEIKQRGYSLIGVGLGSWQSPEACERSIRRLKKIAEEAAEKGLMLQVLTGYQRYCLEALQRKPEWRMRFNDGSYGNEACPFNDEYKNLYLEALRKTAEIQNIFEIQLNDEAHLTNWRDKWACYCDSCKKKFREETGFEIPTVPDWNSEAWREWIKWRFRNWVRVHKEAREAIKSVNPEINVSVQLTPYVDFYPWNPWFSGVDLIALADEMDMLSTDPYHTYHLHDFAPDITYLTEYCKFYKGVVGEKPFHIWPWGAVRPDNTRELTWKDGQWGGILPIAIGAFSTKAWSFDEMKKRERLLRAYEDMFSLDPYFEDAEPLKHIAVVHGFQTEVWLVNENYNLQLRGPTYDRQIFRRTCNFLRVNHILYDHLFDKRLDPQYLAGYKALVLPRIACLSDSQAEAIKDFNDAGGGVLATYDTSLYDEEGIRREDLALMDTLRATVKTEETLRTSGLKILEPTHPIFQGINLDKISCESEAVKVEAIKDGKVLATWIDDEGNDTDFPAIIASEEKGRSIYLTGELWPGRAEDRTQVQALTDILVNAVKWVTADEPEVFIENAPPTIELFPNKSKDYYIATIASYMGDQASITLKVRKPTGMTFSFAEDLIQRKFYEVQDAEEYLEFQVPFTNEDAVKVILIKFR